MRGSALCSSEKETEYALSTTGDRDGLVDELCGR